MSAALREPWRRCRPGRSRRRRRSCVRGCGNWVPRPHGAENPMAWNMGVACFEVFFFFFFFFFWGGGSNNKGKLKGRLRHTRVFKANPPELTYCSSHVGFPYLAIITRFLGGWKLKGRLKSSLGPNPVTSSNQSLISTSCFSFPTTPVCLFQPILS